MDEIITLYLSADLVKQTTCFVVSFVLVIRVSIIYNYDTFVFP